jgi:hypothetical protein
MADHATTVCPMVRARFHRSARYPAGTVTSPLTRTKHDSSSPMPASLTPKSCFNGVTTPRTMFWSTWSIMITSPSTHIGNGSKRRFVTERLYPARESDGHMERVLLALALIAAATAGSVLLNRRRRPQPPTQARWAVPTQLDRADFDGTRPWLVAVFTSTTCESCERATAKAAVLASDAVAYQEVPFQERKDLHQRYGVDAVPTIVVADEEGVVRASFVGVPTATDLWAAVAEARQPGVSPPHEPH